MTATILRFASSSSRAWPDAESILFESVRFMSVCPQCKDLRSQLGYSPRALVRLLKGNRAIEACCVVCDGFWPVSDHERESLAAELLR